MNDENCARCGAHEDDHYVDWENGIPIVGSYQDAPNGRVCSALADELKASVIQNRELEGRIYKIGLMCDSVPGLEDGFCPDVGGPRDNVTRIGIALKSLKESNRLYGEWVEFAGTLVQKIHDLQHTGSSPLCQQPPCKAFYEKTETA